MTRCRELILDRMKLRRRSAMPVWRGWQRLRYGPNARYQIPRMPLLYWHMMGRTYFKSLKAIGNEQLGRASDGGA